LVEENPKKRQSPKEEREGKTLKGEKNANIGEKTRTKGPCYGYAFPTSVTGRGEAFATRGLGLAMVVHEWLEV